MHYFLLIRYLEINWKSCRNQNFYRKVSCMLLFWFFSPHMLHEMLYCTKCLDKLKQTLWFSSGSSFVAWGWPVHLHRALFSMEAMYKVCGITSLWATLACLLLAHWPWRRVKLEQTKSWSEADCLKTVKNVHCLCFSCRISEVVFHGENKLPESVPLVNQSALGKCLCNQFPVT